MCHCRDDFGCLQFPKMPFVCGHDLTIRGIISLGFIIRSLSCIYLELDLASLVLCSMHVPAGWHSDGATSVGHLLEQRRIEMG